MQSSVETDSVANLEVDVDESADTVAVLHVPALVAGLNNAVDPVMAGTAGTLAVEPQADAGERQAFTAEVGRVAERFVPRGATAEPWVDVGAIAGHGDAERAAAQPTVFPYAGLPAPALGAPPVDGRRVPGRELGPYQFPRLPCQRAE